MTDTWRHRYEAALSFCRRCPVTTECLQQALELNEAGVWGGTSPDDRVRLRRMAGRRAEV